MDDDPVLEVIIHDHDFKPQTVKVKNIIIVFELFVYEEITHQNLALSDWSNTQRQIQVIYFERMHILVMHFVFQKRLHFMIVCIYSKQ